MFDVIFVRLKYKPQYAHFRSGTSLDHARFYFLLFNILGIKYSMYDAILLG